MTEFSKRILFVGMPDMALICLEGLVNKGLNIVGAFGAKKQHPTYSMFKNVVNHFGINFLEYDNLSDESFIKNVKALNADLAVVCSFNYKIPKVLLDCVKDGFINVHPSLLPDYKGPNPYSAVLLNKETETGVTLHFMDENFDTGDIVYQKSLKILPYETMGTLFNRLNILAYDMLLATLETYEKGFLMSKKQPEGTFKYASKMKDSDLFINFYRAAEDIDYFIRGLNPFVMARTKFRNTQVKVFSADIVEKDYPSNFVSGQIVDVTDDKFYIATGKGLIAPSAMQFGSFFAGTSKDFIQIVSPKIGEKFS